MCISQCRLVKVPGRGVDVYVSEVRQSIGQRLAVNNDGNRLSVSVMSQSAVYSRLSANDNNTTVNRGNRKSDIRAYGKRECVRREIKQTRGG